MVADGETPNTTVPDDRIPSRRRPHLVRSLEMTVMGMSSKATAAYNQYQSSDASSEHSYTYPRVGHGSRARHTRDAPCCSIVRSDPSECRAWTSFERVGGIMLRGIAYMLQASSYRRHATYRMVHGRCRACAWFGPCPTYCERRRIESVGAQRLTQTFQHTTCPGRHRTPASDSQVVKRLVPALLSTHNKRVPRTK